MRAVILFSAVIALSACGGSGSNSDGSSKSTYSSCKISSSQALFAADRDQDLRQCWNASGNGYASQGDAMQWCEQKVNAYIANTYLVGHTVTYVIESTKCPS